MFRNNSLFSLELPSRKRVIVSAYLTLLTMSYLVNLAAGSPKAVIDCEKLLENLYENSANPGAAVAGYMFLGPVGLLFGARQDKETLAKKLSSQGFCTDYIEEKYQFKQRALEQQENSEKWLQNEMENKREMEKQAHEQYLTKVANCQANYGQEGIAQLLCINKEIVITIGFVFLCTALMVIADRFEAKGKNNTTQKINSSPQVKTLRRR